MGQYFVYIMTNASRTLYTGVTNTIERRVHEHKHKLVPGFTSRYNFTRLVSMETYADPRSAIDREKHLKGWRREKKAALIEGENSGRKDLSEGWFEG